tara:strand:- start:143 stop:595 length:453 start_codon:yes stop_codon:yes gene_type:complete
MIVIKDLRYKKILSLFWKQNGSPFFNAKGVAFGVFSGCFPFFGFQTILGVFLAKLTKGNIILAAIGTWISNPFTYIPLYIFNFKVGLFLLKNPDNIIIKTEFIKENFWRQGWFFTSRLILGSSMVGLFFGLALGLLTYYFYKKKLNNYKN